MLSIVKLADAADLARVEPSLPPTTMAGFAKVVAATRRTGKQVAELIKPLVSKQGGSVVALGEERRILLADLKSRVEQIIDVLQILDLPTVETVVQQVPVEFLEATQLGSLVTAAVATRNALQDVPLRGKLAPIPDGNALILVAPLDELPDWLELIEQFDKRQAVVARSYTPRHFSIHEVGQLLSETGRDLGPRGSGDRWRIVPDELTGTLIVTATQSEHQRIEELIERLDAVPVEARRPVRAFRIRNRGVNEVLDVLTKLIEAGALEAAEIEKPEARVTTARQRTEREVLPPGAAGQAIPGIGTGTAEASRSAPTSPDSPATARVSAGQSLVLTADEGTNTLIAIGDARRLEQLAELIRTLDERQPQVMLEALVLSLTEGDTLDLGVELEVMAV
ncbi:MAG: hypothetical protein L0Z62_05945, partial [Gemmataceae bacterium]|nr:hypothetical protein [Gemmataceae bacterium]